MKFFTKVIWFFMQNALFSYDFVDNVEQTLSLAFTTSRSWLTQQRTQLTQGGGVAKYIVWVTCKLYNNIKVDTSIGILALYLGNLCVPK